MKMAQLWKIGAMCHRKVSLKVCYMNHQWQIGRYCSCPAALHMTMTSKLNFCPPTIHYIIRSDASILPLLQISECVTREISSYSGKIGASFIELRSYRSQLKTIQQDFTLLFQSLVSCSKIGPTCGKQLYHSRDLRRHRFHLEGFHGPKPTPPLVLFT